MAQVSARRRGEAGDDWLWQIIRRKKPKQAAIALANRMARTGPNEQCKRHGAELALSSTASPHKNAQTTSSTQDMLQADLIAL